MDSGATDNEEETSEAADDGSDEALPTARVSASGASGASGRMGKRRKPARKSFGERFRKRWRAWLRAIHRDVGYLAVGLTVIYAVSGIAINHIGDWDPNFAKETVQRSVELPIPTGDEEAATQKVLASLKITAEPRDFFFETDEQLEIFFDEKERTLIVDVTTGAVTETYKSERIFLRVANWLHYNRGKSAWTYIADGYAFFLLFLAISGIFMLKGRKGFLGRGAILILIGAAVPIIYVSCASGP